RTPHSTLFPYTTLFRSRIGRLSAEIGVAHDELRGQAAGDPAVGRKARNAERVQRAGGSERGRILPALRGRPPEARFEERVAARQDRKSTRLNSSHVAIS